MARENMGTNIEVGLVQRVAQGMRFILRGVAPDAWFGPNQPLQPIAQEQAQGRAYDYPVGWNLRITPRQQEGGVTFADLRGLADGCDVLRLAIETRKDQLCRLDWDIVQRDAALRNTPDGRDATAKAVRDFLLSPDKEHDWGTWLRAILEDLLVLDAIAVYPRRTKGGSLYSLDLIDAATINRLLDATGRTPQPPDAAYQQILKGLPAVDYTADTLIYRARNVRTHRAYGYSPVEQVLMTVNIALRRQVHQLQYYTEGNLPDFIFRVAETWNPEQIKQFQEYWDSLMVGNTANRRKGLFIPQAADPVSIRQPDLKNEFDEWLARLVCYAFSLPPQALIKEVNRATAETSKAAAEEDGLKPYMRWLKAVMDFIIARHLGAPDLEFAWVVEQSVKPVDQAQIDSTYLAAGVLDINEVRERMGLVALTPEQLEERKPKPLALAPGKDTEQGDEPDDAGDDDTPPPAQKLAKADSTDIDTLAGDEIAALADGLAPWLATEGGNIAREMSEALTVALGKTEAPTALIEQVLGSVDWGRWNFLIKFVGAALRRVGKNTVVKVLTELPLPQTDVDAAEPEVLDNVQRWADDRAAALVGKSYNALGELIDSPNPAMSITATTRAMLRDLVAKGVAENWTPQELAKAIQADAAFGGARARTIARTELSMAYSAASMASYRAGQAMGLDIRKAWSTAQDDKVDPECVANGNQGPIALDAPFSSGAYVPPAHPNCRCAVVPVIIDGSRSPVKDKE